jgi:spore maturation protein CgeB
MRYLYSPYIVKRRFFNKWRSYKKFDPKFYQKNLTTQIYHYPWFTDLNLYRPQEEKEWDVIFLGSWGKRVYPLRNRIVKDLPKLSKKKKWRCLIKGRPPGETTKRNINALKKDGYLVGDKYSDIIARSKIFIFGNSIFDYPLSKYFEIMGSRTLVMADKPQTVEDLHFIPGVNFIEINSDTWKEKLEYYLEDDNERERVAQNGYDTVLRYHSSKIRAKNLLSYLKEADRRLKN